MNKEDIKSAIKELFQRGGVSVDEKSLNALTSLASVATFSKQETILDIGEKQNYVYLILSGMARSYYIDEKGNDITKLFMRENEFLIGEAMFMDESLEVFEAVEDIKCLRFDAKEFKKIMLSNPVLERVYIARLEATIRYKMRREYAFQCLNATERYLEFQKAYPGIEERLPQHLIASYLGITKESLSRIRKNI